MATQTSIIAKGLREDLSDVISRISPAETPIFSNMSVETITSTNHEFLVQELASASASNFNNEGADFSYATPTQMTRLGNQSQIFIQSAQVSETLESVDKAGRAKEIAYQTVLKSLEQRKDIEATLVASQAKSASDPRKMGSIECWISNVSGAGDATEITTHDGANLRTDGTGRALTLAMVDSVAQAIYEDGGEPSMMVLSPSKKVTFSDLASGSVATNQVTMTANQPVEVPIIGSVSVFLSDFGKIDITIDRQMPNDRIYIFDPQHMKMGALPNRQFSKVDVAKTGDSQKFGIVSEFTYIPTAPKAHGAIYDLS